MNSATNADELATSLQAHYDEVIDREMVRLAHRTPSLEPADLRTVHSALRELVERLVVARGNRRSSQVTPPRCSASKRPAGSVNPLTAAVNPHAEGDHSGVSSVHCSVIVALRGLRCLDQWGLGEHGGAR